LHSFYLASFKVLTAATSTSVLEIHTFEKLQGNFWLYVIPRFPIEENALLF